MIVDLNQVMISNLMAQIGNHTNIQIEPDLVRHMVLNAIRSYRVKYKEYGETIIACDDKKYWRRDVFPYYKAHRKRDREASELDWHAIFECLNTIREELKEFFPYRVIQVEGAEADDIIGTLCKEYGSPLLNKEKILILSGDKDFVQLQKYANVEQYDPVRKKFIRNNDPVKFIQEHIMKGDRGDGVPNMLSSDNCLVLGERQKPLSAKKLDQWVDKDPESIFNEQQLRGYKRNQQLVDLDYIPVEVSQRVMESYHSQSNKDRSKLFNYFISRKLKHLLENINEF